MGTVAYIGLLMIAYEDDVLEEILDTHMQIVDVFYALDGTKPVVTSRAICRSQSKCAGYWTEDELPETYGKTSRDGWRQYLYEQAIADCGYDNWFLLLHGDELWMFQPNLIVASHPDADGFIFRLPCYFPRDPWDYDRASLEQLTWHLWPGWPEFRMFRGAPHVQYDLTQHFNVEPRGLQVVVSLPDVIRHYPYRAPEVQRRRARHHQETGFDPDNFRHVIEGDQVIWDDALIARFQRHSMHFREVRDGGTPSPV